MPLETDPASSPQNSDVTRRTWLAAERTWLAWWRTGIAVLILGGRRQQRTADALRRGSYDELSSSLVLWLTAAGVAVSLGAVLLVAIRL